MKPAIGYAIHVQSGKQIALLRKTRNPKPKSLP